MNSVLCDQQSVQCSCFDYLASIRTGLKPSPKPISPDTQETIKLRIPHQNAENFLANKKSLKRDTKHKRNYTFVDNQKGITSLSTTQKIGKGQNFLHPDSIAKKEPQQYYDIPIARNEKRQVREECEKIRIFYAEKNIEESEKIFSTRAASVEQNFIPNFPTTRPTDFDQVSFSKKNMEYLCVERGNNIRCKEIESIMDEDESEERSEVIGKSWRGRWEDEEIEALPTMVERKGREAKGVKSSLMGVKKRQINKQ